MRECTLKKIETELSGITWDNVITENVDTSFNVFHDTVCTIIDKHSPVKSRSINVKKLWKEPWITKGLQKCIRKQKLLYQDSIRSGANPLATLKYREYRNILVKIKHEVHKEYYANKCFEFKHNTKKLWQLINDISRKTNNKTELVECLHINNIDCYDASSIVNEFGKYFSYVAKSFAESIPAPKKSIKKFIDKMLLNEKVCFCTK